MEYDLAICEYTKRSSLLAHDQPSSVPGLSKECVEVRKNRLLSNLLTGRKKHSLPKRRPILSHTAYQETIKEEQNTSSEIPKNYDNKEDVYEQKIKLEPKIETERRYSLNVYISSSNYQNLRYFKLKTRYSKQALVEAALTEFFKRVSV